MKAFFKDNDKIIINSLDHNERLVGEAFIEAYKEGSNVVIASRNDVNDDFDGFVITLVEPVSNESTNTEQVADENVEDTNSEGN